MKGSGGAARRVIRLAGYEYLFVAYGAAAVSVAIALGVTQPSPPRASLLALCALSALAVHFNTRDSDAARGLALSAEGVVIAAAVFVFRESSPLLAPLLVGMAAAFWRVPRTRHQWFTIAGNFGGYGLSALAGAMVLQALPLGDQPTAFELALVALPVAMSYLVANGALVGAYLLVTGEVGARDVLAQLRADAIGMYVPFVFGAFVGELSLRYGLGVFALAAATFVMIQAVFASYRKLVESEQQTCEGLIAAVERKDPYTAGHSARVAKFARYIGGQLGIKGAALARVERHGLMHDIGKLAVPNHVLRKPGRLDDDERILMLRHEPAGAAILAQIPLLRDGATVASGKDDRKALTGPIRTAHIVHAADAFDAMTSTRAYRQPHTQADAVQEMYAKAGVQFHRGTVDALVAELDSREECYGLGCEEEIAVYDTPPPVAALGHTLHDGEPAPEENDEPTTVEKPTRLPLPRDMVAAIWFGIVAVAAGIVAAIGVEPAIPVALGALVAAGELVCLRPLGRAARPLSLVPMLVALHALTLPYAIAAIAGGIATAACAREHKTFKAIAIRFAVAATTVGTYAVVRGPLHVDTSVGGALLALVECALMALLTQDIFERETKFDVKNRLADLALVTCGPLAALGATHADGLGMGALVILAVPLALLAQGFDRNQRARTNLFAWLQAASVAPEYAELVPKGRAARVARNVRALAAAVGLDDELTDQLEAAAWMERVGECCLDESYVTGFPHTREQIVEESAAILKSTKAFYEAGQILWAHLDEPELATDVAIHRAGQILRVVVAFEDATEGEYAGAQISGLFARLRNSDYHPLDAELCDVFQQLVAPGSARSPWTPVQIHALATCGCVTAVDEFTFQGDPFSCVTHGDQAILDLATDRMRAQHTNPETARVAAAELLEGARGEANRTREVLRELYTRLAADHDNEDLLVAITQAAFERGAAWEGAVAQWLREAGTSPRHTGAVLSEAGTPEWDTHLAVHNAYSADELDHPGDAVLPGPAPTDAVSPRRPVRTKRRPRVRA